MAAAVGKKGRTREREGGWGRQVLPKCVTKAPRCVTAKRRHMWYALLLYIYISYIVRSTSCCPCQLTASDVCRRQLRSCRYTYGGIQIQIPTEIQMQIQIQSERKGTSERMPVFVIRTFRINKYLCIYLLFVGARIYRCIGPFARIS